FLPKKRLQIAGSRKPKPDRSAMGSNREFKGKERAAELLVGDECRQQRVMLIVEAIRVPVGQLAHFPHEASEELADQFLMGGTLLARKRRHVTVEEKIRCLVSRCSAHMIMLLIVYEGRSRDQPT